MNKPMVDRFRRICFLMTRWSGDAGAFERTLRVCERESAHLDIVGLADSPPPAVLRLMESLGVSSEPQSHEAARLDQLLEIARQRNVSADSELLHGPAALVVVRKVLRHGHGLLVKAAQPSTAIRHLLFGHMDRQLVRKCPCPVWIEKPADGVPHDRVLAAVAPVPFDDDPDFDPVREELNTSILQMAAWIAQLEDAELHVVHVWPSYLEQRLQHWAGLAGLTEDALTRVEESIRMKHEHALAPLLGPFMRRISRVHLLKGEAAEEIPRLTASEGIDILVMGTVCRTGIAGWFIGNTAETALDQIECSLVALKPLGFVTPIRLA